jgi:hypothetical protein
MVNPKPRVRSAKEHSQAPLDDGVGKMPDTRAVLVAELGVPTQCKKHDKHEAFDCMG